MKYLPVFHHFKAIYQSLKHIFFLVKVVANASLNKNKNCKNTLNADINFLKHINNIAVFDLKQSDVQIKTHCNISLLQHRQTIYRHRHF